MIDVVAALICNSQGEVLCMQRGAGKYAYTDYKYEFPGGKIESNETPQQALRRELLEEMDLEVTVGEQVADIEHHYPDFDIRLRVFRCTPTQMQFKLKEHANSLWLSLDCLDQLDWAAADLAVIAQLSKLAARGNNELNEA